jgi:hypothetical protein
MIFIVIGAGEAGPVSSTCKTAAAALEQARRLNEQGIRDVLIDANGQDRAPPTSIGCSLHLTRQG